MGEGRSGRVRDLIAKHASRKVVVDRGTDLWSDLRIEGDDVDELFRDLQDEFDPLDTQPIIFEKHFEMNEPPWCFDWLGRKKRKFKIGRVPVAVGDVEIWIDTGKWPIEYAEHASFDAASDD